MYKVTFVFILLFGSILKIHSQNRFLESYTISLFLGTRDLQIDSLPDTDNLDFINYMSFLDYEPIGAQYIGVSADLKFRGGAEMSFTLFSNDDIFPTGVNLSAQYFFTDLLGINIGGFAHPLFTSDYQMFHVFRDGGQFHADRSIRQRDVFNLGWMVGPAIQYREENFFVNMQLNLGMSGFAPFSEEFMQQEFNSNFRRVIRYETEFNSEFLFIPRLRAGVDLIKFNNSTLGLQLKSSYLLSRRSLDYYRTTFNWTAGNAVVEKIYNPKHRFNIFEVDLGIFLRFNNNRGGGEAE